MAAPARGGLAVGGAVRILTSHGEADSTLRKGTQ